MAFCRKMEVDETKKEVTTSATAAGTKEGNEPKMSAPEEAVASSSTAANVDSADAESRRSSVSLDDDDEGKRIKRRKEKEEHSRSGKEDVRAAKEDHGHGKKDEHPPKKEEHTHKKDEFQHKKEEHTGTPRAKPSSASSSSPKSTTSVDGLDGEEGVRSVGSPGPKVPPLKIVIPPVESEQGSRNGKNTTRHHPYVVVSNDETSTAVSTVTTSPSSPSVQTTASKEEAHSPSSASTALTSEEQRGQQRVLRSSNSNRDRGVASNSSTNGCSSGTNSSATSGSSSPVAPDLSPQQEPAPPKEDSKVKTEPGVRSKTEATTKGGKMESTVKVKTEPEEEAKASVSETRSTTVDTSSVELHPRKRKLKSKPEPSHAESDHLTSFGSAPHPHEVPVTNCYQMFIDIRRQIDVKRKGLFPIQPKPPQGFKDYLMNRCTYTLAGNSVPRLKRRNAEPPEGIAEGMKELYQEQEAERYSLRMQHVVEKEKLVLSVEQEILRVHGRAARALANQALPFSACTILKDEEVYNVITPEQEEKDRNARSRYNGRLFISWLQDVDDKWEKIKEEMLARHHKEAESLNAIQKFKWDLKMRQLGLWKKRHFVPVENLVPMLSVSDDFDLLPE